MTTATADRTTVFDKTIVVADHFRVQLQRHTFDDGEEEIIATVPADWDFGDWRKDEPDAGPDGAMHPDHNAVLKDCSREIGFDLVYAELDGGIDITENGPIVLTFERAPDALASEGDQPPVQGKMESAAPETAPPTEPEPPRVQGLSELELLRRQLHKANQQLAYYRDGQVHRRYRAQRIAQLRQVMEEDKKRLAGSKADLEEAILGWCNEEAADEPLCDYAARSEPALPPTNGTHQPATPSANGASAKGPQGAQPPADDESWKKEPLAVLGLTEAILKKLDANDPPLRTVGDLQQMVERLGKEGFTDPIAQIKGIGAKTAEKIDAAFQEFWAKRPAPVEQTSQEVIPNGKPPEQPAAPAGVSPVAESNGKAATLATPAVDAQAKALTEALIATHGAAERWAKLKASGATDAQLKAAIATEFGAAGGGSEFHFEGGKSPKFWLGEDRSGKPTLAGKALLAKVREVMGVPEGGEEAE